MNIEELRNAFKECRIAVSPNGVSVLFYDFSESGWVHASPVDYSSIVSVAENSSAIRLVLKPGKSAEILFCMGIPVDVERVFAPIQTGDENHAEIEKVIRESDHVYDFRFIESFKDVDLHSDKSILECLANYFDKIGNDRPVELSGISNWSSFRKICRDFWNASGFLEYEEEDPGGFCDFGTVIFSKTVYRNSVFEISKQHMRSFVEMLRNSSGFSFDCRCEDLEIYFGLSVYS